MSPNVGLRRRRRIAPVRYTVSGRESTGSTPTWAGDERGIRLRCICLGDAALRSGVTDVADILSRRRTTWGVPGKLHFSHAAS